MRAVLAIGLAVAFLALPGCGPSNSLPREAGVLRLLRRVARALVVASASVRLNS